MATCVRVRADAPVIRNRVPVSSASNTPCYPSEDQVGKKLEVVHVKSWEMPNGHLDTVYYFPDPVKGYSGGVSLSYLEPWRDDEMWDADVRKWMSPAAPILYGSRQVTWR